MKGIWSVSEPASNHVTQLLIRWKSGDEQALHDLVPIVYRELRRLAHYYLRSERTEHTLQSTALVHEAYLRLIGGKPADLQNRDHFFAVASRLMRQILVDYARNRNAAKRDGGCRVTLSDAMDVPIKTDQDLMALDRALEELARIDERQAKIVELKFFGGLSSSSAASVASLFRYCIFLARAGLDGVPVALRGSATERAWLSPSTIRCLSARLRCRLLRSRSTSAFFS